MNLSGNKMKISVVQNPFAIALIALAIVGLSACSSNDSAGENGLFVTNQQEFETAVDQLKPGDTLVLANGVWNDFEILFVGEGTAEQPITLTAETKGEVIISGQSNLRIAGEHLIVSGLVFKDGYTPTDSVINFRRNSTHLANNSRVTEVVIDHFSNPERRETDYWVAMYGKNNRFDHNHMDGKSNVGVTMAVRLNTEESLENHHLIDHNYFGPRAILGSNGGETLRIGTSHYSLEDSFTVVENNYFDRADGELEIISNKSGGNVFRGNVFFESRGTLTMRHGSNTLVEDNVFFGNGTDHSGGIRVINGHQTIRNNYMEGLAGYRFGGALVVMNGVPNSPINRYHQVENALIENNSLVNSDHVQLAAGSDLERSAIPVDSRMANNLFYSEAEHDIFTVYDDISGIEFENNVQNRDSEFGAENNFATQSMQMERAANGLLYPTDPALAEMGVSRDLDPVQKEETGVSWYAKPEKSSTFGGGSVVNVDASEGSLGAAVRDSNPGDVLVLAAGDHVVSRILEIQHPITISGEGNVRIDYERGALFEIKDGGSLYLKGLTISGELTPDSAGNTLIRTQRGSMLSNYELIIEDSNIVDLDINHSFNVLTVEKSTLADNIRITNSNFSNITGYVLKLDAEIDDFGIYNSEYVTIENSTFENVQGALVSYYRGGTDESTFGPHFQLTDSRLTNVGNGSRNRTGSSMLLHGVQVSTIYDNQIVDSLPIVLKHTVGEPVTRIFENSFNFAPAISVEELNSDKENTAHIYDNQYAGGAN